MGGVTTVINTLQSICFCV